MQNKGKKGINPKIDTRTLTVSYLVSQSAYRKSFEVPFLRLRGKWLKEAGFDVDQKIQVIVSKNLIIIIPIPQQESNE